MGAFFYGGGGGGKVAVWTQTSCKREKKERGKTNSVYSGHFICELSTTKTAYFGRSLSV